MKYQPDEQEPPALWPATGPPLAVEEVAVLVPPCEIPYKMWFLVPAAQDEGLILMPASLTSRTRF